jgi:hypothetical protein
VLLLELLVLLKEAAARIACLTTGEMLAVGSAAGELEWLGVLVGVSGKISGDAHGWRVKERGVDILISPDFFFVNFVSHILLLIIDSIKY